MSAFVPVLADAAEEGADIVLSMLVVGLVLVAVVLIGDVYNWARGRSKAS
jgi:hypothetical protein